jgi:hypothetical protein
MEGLTESHGNPVRKANPKAEIRTWDFSKQKTITLHLMVVINQM